MKWINAFCLICIFPCVAFSAESKPELERLFHRADSLLMTGNHFEAAIGYERVFYLASSPEVKTKANLGKSESLKQMGAYGKARRDLERSLVYRSDTALRLEVIYQLAFCAYMEADFTDAHSLVMQWKLLAADLNDHRVMLLEALLLAEAWKWEELRTHLLEWINHDIRHAELSDEVLWTYDSLVFNVLRGAEKSESKARILSAFLPGTGQLYTGNTGWGVLNATSQLASLGLFAWLTLNGFYLAGPIMGLSMFQSFYFGGINQAGILAERHNETMGQQIRFAAVEFLTDLYARLAD